MQLHELHPIHKFKKPKRIGRGGKKGTYSGRGVKGQKSRAGKKLKPIIDEIIKKYPKLRGYRFKSRSFGARLAQRSWAAKLVILNLDILENKFNSGEKVTPQILLEKKLIRKIKGRMPEVKILGRAPGEMTKKLIIESCQVSKSVKEKIEKAGGKIL